MAKITFYITKEALGALVVFADGLRVVSSPDPYDNYNCRADITGSTENIKKWLSRVRLLGYESRIVEDNLEKLAAMAKELT